MTIQEKAIKLQDLFNNEAFICEAKEITTEQQLQDLFARNGIELTSGEVTDFLNELFKRKEKGEELSDIDLEAVSGGIISGGAFLAWSVMYLALNVLTKLAGVW